MIKESIFSFLKIRKMPIIIFTGIVVIFGILFYLYDIPFDAIIYGCELSFVWCAVCLFIDFYKYYKRHKLLHINREQFFDDAEQLPEHMDIIEYDYQELAKELYCLLYTSDAADDGESVDLGGRRIIKKIF